MSANTSSATTQGMEHDYNENSCIQMAAVQSSATYIKQGVDALSIDSPSLVMIADYGSSHGSNSMHAMKFIIHTMKQLNKINEDKQQILVVHNDLPSNDWTSVFNSLAGDPNYFGVASGRSFYEQCLPSNSLAIGYSSIALHWLSRKPCNLSNRCMVDTSQTDEETKAFKNQAATDYAKFLECRSRELLPGGVLILVILAESPGDEHREHAKLLYRCAEKLLTAEELFEYTFPIYSRSYSECVDQELFKKFNFEVINAESVSVKSTLSEQLKAGKLSLNDLAHIVTMGVRSALEYPLRQALKISGQRSVEEIERVLEQYWMLHEDGMKEQSKNYDSDMTTINLVLRKLKE